MLTHGRTLVLEELIQEGMRMRDGARAALAPRQAGPEEGAPRPPDWSLAAAADGASADLYLYDTIGFGGIPARDVVAQLRAVAGRPVRVHLNSPGGDVFAGLAIYNALRAHRGGADVLIEGVAASIASIVAMGGRSIRMAAAALLMIHEPHAFVMGEARDMRKMAALLDQTADLMADVYASRGLDRDEVRAWMAEETWWTGAQALKAGLTDGVDDAELTPEAMAARERFDLRAYRHFPRPAEPVAPPRQRELTRVLLQGLDSLIGRAAA